MTSISTVIANRVNVFVARESNTSPVIFFFSSSAFTPFEEAKTISRTNAKKLPIIRSWKAYIFAWSTFKLKKPNSVRNAIMVSEIDVIIPRVVSFDSISQTIIYYTFFFFLYVCVCVSITKSMTSCRFV